MIGRVVAVAYVATVAGLAGSGFANGSTAAILLATALALPFGAPALVGFYMAYGLLALVPGANPDESSGSASCTAAGVCTSSSTGDLATWFQLATDAIGVTALIAAAIANVVAVRWLIRLQRAPSGSAAAGASSPSHPTPGDATTPTPPDPAGS